MNTCAQLMQFGCNVFSDEVMKGRLDRDIYAALRQTIEQGSELTIDIADAVATAMKDWAVEKGATHYTHWFQPMTGSTAEKHDAFLYFSSLGAQPVLHFSGKALIKGEADGSSFPSGGLRATFEARGYTTWDCTSPAFVRQDQRGVSVLCIPTAFCSFSGEALDEKTPLLRSMEAVNRQALRVLGCLGYNKVRRVTPTVGAEQEYFLVDKKQFERRKDIVYTGRTLFGAPPAKGQELGDQYYATTPEGVAQFMRDLNLELWRLGVPAKTQHNEAAPSQYELAPLFASANVACDHNQLIMEQMRRVADRHGYACLLHEKPFAFVNGSGKHNNWSLTTDNGRNLLKIGRDVDAFLLFATFFIATIAAVDEYAPALRMSCATLGNENRLGGNEAPPPIISVFTGSKLYDDLCAFVHGEKASSCPRETMNMGVSTFATLYKDDSDRNRTSPFAFTGDKFEFRMVGASQSIGLPNTVINTIVAEMLMRIADTVEGAADKTAALKNFLRVLWDKHSRIIFNGNNYSPEWISEAERRGLPVINGTIDALMVLNDENVISIFERHGVLKLGECNARLSVELSNYIKLGRIEAHTMIKLSRQRLLPACTKYAGDLARDLKAVTDVGMDATAQISMLKKVTALINEYYEAVESLADAYTKLGEGAGEGAGDGDDAVARALRFSSIVKPAMLHVRVAADALERIVGKSCWPIPSYGEMLFHVGV